MIKTEYISHYKSILRLGFPIMLGQLGIIVVGFVDTMMVGHYSTQGLAAASFVNNLFMFVTMLCMGFSYGLTPLVGALFSRGEYKSIGETVKNGVLVNLIFGTVVVVAMTIVYFNIHHFGQPEELLPIIGPYFLTMLSSLIFVSLFNVMRQFADGISKTSLSMWILLSGNLLNIIFNYLLIFGKFGFPELGLLGAGISTLGSRIFMALTFVVIVLTTKVFIKYREGLMVGKVEKSKMKMIFRASMPVSLQMGMETGLFSFSAVMVGWLGSIALASYQVILTIGMLGYIVYYGFGSSVAIKVSNFVGVNDIKNVRLVAKCGFHIQLVLALCSSLLFLFFAENIISWFTDDIAVISATVMLIFPLILYQFGDAIQINFANALRGTSYVMPMMWIALISYILVGIPLAYIMCFVFELGVSGAFIAFSASLFLAGGLFTNQFYHRLKSM
ncbi:MAG: MATE family efflux transporter [Muribaculaceae bacterium]